MQQQDTPMTEVYLNLQFVFDVGGSRQPKLQWLEASAHLEVDGSQIF